MLLNHRVLPAEGSQSKTFFLHPSALLIERPECWNITPPSLAMDFTYIPIGTMSRAEVQEYLEYLQSRLDELPPDEDTFFEESLERDMGKFLI